MQLEQIEVGQVLQSWHDAGAGRTGGPQPVYYSVLKKGQVKVRVRSEFGDEGWMYPASFTKSMRAEDVDFVQWK